MKRYLAVLLVATAALAAGASRASAHHSFAATYLEDQQVTIEGEIVQFLFRNPHSFVHVNVKEKDGSVTTYNVEWGATGHLNNTRVTRETLKVGPSTVREIDFITRRLFDECSSARKGLRHRRGRHADRMWIGMGAGNGHDQRHGSRPERRRVARRDDYRHTTGDRADAYHGVERHRLVRVAQPAPRPLSPRGDAAGLCHVRPERDRPAGEREPGRQSGDGHQRGRRRSAGD